MKDINISPCRWHMRIWDVKNNEWLCKNDKDALPYYGFDIRGGEVTALQGMSWVYSAFAHGKEFIWEQSTGLKDKNGKEIYEGDIVSYTTCYYGKEREHTKVIEWAEWVSDDYGMPYNVGFFDVESGMEVIGNVHENPELIGEKNE